MSASASDPLAPPGTLIDIYRTWANLGVSTLVPEVSDTGGGLGTFEELSSGIFPLDPAGFTPPLAISPVKFKNIQGNGTVVFVDVLLYGTDRVYVTETNANVWDNISQPLSRLGGRISALAIAG